MIISISERLRPFSHTPGTRCVLPHTTLSFEIFPTLIRVYNLKNGDALEKEHSLPIEGPVKDFTIQLDLEKGRITVWGFDKSGYFRYHITATVTGWKLTVDKSENKQLQSYNDTDENRGAHPQTERLSLGNHKVQDWDQVIRRQDMTEILPVWHRAGLFLKEIQDVSEKAFDVDALKALFLTGFEGILSPTTYDKLYQGYGKIEELSLESLIVGSHAIRRLFIEEDKTQQVRVLCHVPSEFHYGRFVGISLANGLFVDLEWTKKFVRRMIIYGKGKSSFKFHADVKHFRLRHSEQDKGVFIKDTDTVLTIEEGDRLLLDRFE